MPPNAVTFDGSIATSNNDYAIGSSVAGTNGTTAYMGWQGFFHQYGGLRFTPAVANAPLKNQLISAAKLNLYAYGYHNGTQVVPGAGDIATSGGLNPITVRIWGALGKNSANPATYDTSGFNALSKTTAFVDWTPAQFSNNVRYDTPDLSAVVQELVGQAD